MNAKQLYGLESEEPDECPMKRKPRKIPSVVDLLKLSDSRKEYSESDTVQTIKNKKCDSYMSSSSSESGTYSEKFTKKIVKAKPKPTNNRMSINLCEDSRVENNGPTRKTTPVKEDRMSFFNTSDHQFSCKP